MALTYSWPGVDALTNTTDARKALAGLIETDTSGNARPGVFPSNLNSIITARADMNVYIAAFQGVAVQFGGPILLTNDAVANLPAVLVSPASGTNFYVIYAKQNENTSPGTDANNNTLYGAALSTTSFALARATLPAGALELGTVQMPSGKTATNAVGVTITQTFQYTATDGAAVYVRNDTELQAWTPADGSRAYQIDIKTFATRVSGAWVLDDSGWVTLTVGTGWTANNPPPRIRRVGNVVTLSGVLAYNATGSYNNLVTIPAGYIPTAVSGGTIYYIGQANMRVSGTAGTGFTGPLVVTISTGVVQLDLGYSTGSATPTFVTLSGSWVLG